VLSALSGLTVAIAAIHWSAFTGLKRHFGFLATLSAYGGEHLASGSVAVVIVSGTLCLPGFATSGATLRLIGIAFRLKELLLLNAESEGSPTIGTLECFLLKAHRITSSLLQIG